MLHQSRLIFTEITINLLITPAIELNWSFKKIQYITFSDFEYGRFIIFDNNQPAFIFQAFNDDGSDRIISKEAKQLGMNLDSYVLQRLKSNGYPNVYLYKKPMLAFRNNRKARVKQFTLMNITSL
jgi:hypothetical protein